MSRPCSLAADQGDEPAVERGSAIVDRLLRERQPRRPRLRGPHGEIARSESGGFAAELREVGNRLARLVQQRPARGESARFSSDHSGAASLRVGGCGQGCDHGREA